MEKQRAFVMADFVVYLFLASLTMSICLGLFQITWHSFKSLEEKERVMTDFTSVSERIKFDLLREVYHLEVTKDSISYELHQFSSKLNRNLTKTYELKMSGRRLVYVISDGASSHNLYLSSLIQGIRCERDPKLLTIEFDYGQEKFRRCFAIEQIQP